MAPAVVQTEGGANLLDGFASWFGAGGIVRVSGLVAGDLTESLFVGCGHVFD